MCFGSPQTSTSNTTQNQFGTTAQTGTSNLTGTQSGTGTTTGSNLSNVLPAWLQSAAQQNVTAAQNLQNTGFQPYTGQMVANFSPQQLASFGLGNGIAGAVSPNIQLAGTGLSSYLNNATNQPTVTPQTISSQMSPYMNQYVGMALAPQIAAAQNQQTLGQQQTQGQATSAGAFGDPRATMLQQNQQLINNLSNQGLIGNAYNSAFNTAIGAGAQDVANNLQGQVTNAGLFNTGLANQLAGVNAAYNQGTGATNMLNTLGQQQTAQQQANLNALYQQYLMAQQYPFLTSQNLNQALGGAAAASPNASTQTGTQAQTANTSQTGTTNQTGNYAGNLTGSTVTSSPDNSGFGILGSIFGGLAGNSALPTMLAGLEKGGTAPANRPAVVGEKGPEIFVPQSSGIVIPFDRVKAAVDQAEKEKPDKRNEALARALGLPGFADGGVITPNIDILGSLPKLQMPAPLQMPGAMPWANPNAQKQQQPQGPQGAAGTFQSAFGQQGKGGANPYQNLFNALTGKMQQQPSIDQTMVNAAPTQGTTPVAPVQPAQAPTGPSFPQASATGPQPTVLTPTLPSGAPMTTAAPSGAPPSGLPSWFDDEFSSFGLAA